MVLSEIINGRLRRRSDASSARPLTIGRPRDSPTRSGPGLAGPGGRLPLAAHRDLALAGTEVLHREAGDVGGDVLGAPRCQDAIVALTPTSRTVVPPLGSDNPRSVDFPRWLIGGATSGRVRHVLAGAPKAGYFAAFFLRSAQ